MSDEGEKKGVKGFLADILTEDDAATIFDFVRVLAVVACVVLIGLAIGHFAADMIHFDFENTARGLGEFFAGVGAAIFGKGKSGC